MGRNPSQCFATVYDRSAQGGCIELVRVLHERMEPSRHVRAVSGNED
jgi:hypothetical protein